MGVNRDSMAVCNASAGSEFKSSTMAVPSGYKRTEEGVIPRDWELKQIGDIATVFSGGTPNRKTPEYWGGDVPWITTTLIAGGEIRQANEFITVTGVERSSAKWCKAGTILMAMYGQGKTRGKVAILNIDATINQACAAIELNDSSSSEYILHVLNYMYEDIRELSNSGGQENLSGRIIKRIRIPFPTEPEQRAIATAFSDVDALLEGLDRLIAKKRDLKQAAMQQLLTGQTRLPGFEGDWEVKRLGDVADTDPENLSSSTNPDYTFNYIALEDVSLGRMESCSNINFSSAPSRARRKLRAGDILMATVRPNLKAHLHFDRAEGEWVCSTGFCVIRCRQAVSHAGYVFQHLFAYPINKQVEALIAGSNYPAISNKDVRELELPAPPYEEQAAISTVLSDMDAELEALEQRRTKTAALKQAMMQELLTGRTRLVESTAKECTNG